MSTNQAGSSPARTVPPRTTLPPALPPTDTALLEEEGLARGLNRATCR